MTFEHVDVFENKSIQNLILLGKPQKIVCFRSTSGQIFLCGISTVLWVCKCFVNRKCICCQHWFFIKTFYTVSKKKLSNCGPRNRCFQILIQKWKFCDLLKIDPFADTFQEYCLDFKQHCIPFWNFQITSFTESFSVSARDSSARLLWLPRQCGSACV